MKTRDYPLRVLLYHVERSRAFLNYIFYEPENNNTAGEYQCKTEELSLKVKERLNIYNEIEEFYFKHVN